MNTARKDNERAPDLTLFGTGAVGVGRDRALFFKVGDRVRFLFDHATGTIVREFKGLTPADPTYVVRLDRPDEDGRIRTAWAGVIE